MRPPTLEIPATPNRDLPDMRQLQRAIDPAAATPARRADIPIGMIIEGNERYWFAHGSKPQSGQMMEVTRAVEDKFAKLRPDLAIKLLDRPRRSRKTKVRSPLRRVDGGQAVRDLVPGGVEIKMNGRTGRAVHGLGRDWKRDSLARAMRKFSAASARSGLSSSARSNWTMACEV